MPDVAGRKILVTAGPTWVPLDKVRVITNVFSGRTGCDIAEELVARKADVTLLLGPGGAGVPAYVEKEARVVRFTTYDELFALVKKEVSSKTYDVIIHSAAVADYCPVKVHPGKITSKSKTLVIKLKPTVKIVDQMKKWDPAVFLVKFKLQVGMPHKKLIDIGYKSMLHSHADLMVANNLEDIAKGRIAFIIDRDKTVMKVSGAVRLARTLVDIIALAV